MFARGFKKIAEENDKRNTALAAGGAALATHTYLRSGKKTNLMRTHHGKDPGTILGRLKDRVLYGADEVGYTNFNKTPKKAKHYKGTVLHEQEGSKSFHKGDKNIGDFTSRQQHALENKHTEHKLLKKYEKGHPKASLMDNFKGKDKAQKMYGEFKNGFLVKPIRGMASGVGGASFLSDEDYAKKHLGIKNKKKRDDLMKKTHKDGRKHLVQEKMNIKKDALTGASREMRVHAIGGKVVPGATGIRGGNVLDHFHARSAEKHMQSVLDKMPAKHKKHNLTWAADVAMTDKGMKIIETNRGINASGLLDPKFLKKTHKGLKGTVAGAAAVSKNNAIYKHITGRHTHLAAGGRALMAAGVVAAGAKMYQKHHGKHGQEMT